MNKLKGALRSKTVWFSFAVMAAGMAQDNLHFLEGFLTPDQYGKATAVIGAATLILRAFTNSSLADKGADQ